MKLSTYTVHETKFAVGKIYIGDAYTGDSFDVTRFFFRAVKRTTTAMVFQFLGSQRQKSVYDEPRIDIAGDNSTQRRKIRVGILKVEDGGWGETCWREFRDEECTAQLQFDGRAIDIPLVSSGSYVD